MKKIEKLREEIIETLLRASNGTATQKDVRKIPCLKEEKICSFEIDNWGYWTSEYNQYKLRDIYTMKENSLAIINSIIKQFNELHSRQKASLQFSSGYKSFYINIIQK